MDYNHRLMPDLTDERGFSLVSVMVAMGLLVLVGIAATSMLSNTFKGNKSNQMTDELISVKRVLRDKVDCKKTLDKQSCPSKGKFFPLKDKADRIVGSNFGDYWKLGSWTLRASCDAVEMAIEFARTDSHGSFLKDPFTQKMQGWKNLFPDGDLSCSSEVQELSGKKGPVSNCNAKSGICEDQTRKKWKLITGDINYDPNWGTSECHAPNFRHFTGMVRCPAGYIPSGGGGECAIPPWLGGILASSRIVSPHSSFKLRDESKPGYPWRTMYTNDTNQYGWYVDCCAQDPKKKSPDGSNYQAKGKDQVFVFCVPDHE